MSDLYRVVAQRDGRAYALAAVPQGVVHPASIREIELPERDAERVAQWLNRGLATTQWSAEPVAEGEGRKV